MVRWSGAIDGGRRVRDLGLRLCVYSMHRDDFSVQVKRALAARTGYRCSRPACDAPTSGPAEDLTNGATNLGVAAHITGASPKGPRYDTTLTQEERRSIDNGIWLCQNDAHLIDADEARFTIELLRSWRETAEKLARRRQGLPDPATAGANRRLSVHSRRVGPVRLREDVAEFLHDIGAGTRWGHHLDAVRVFLIELGLNAFSHGKVSEIELSSDGKRVRLRDSGAPFGIVELRNAGRGGHHALHALDADTDGELNARYQREDDCNIWLVVEAALEEGRNGPCSFVIKRRPPRDTNQLLKKLASCPEIHCYVDYASSTISDVTPILEELLPRVSETANVYVHGLTSRYLRELLSNQFPAVTFVG